MLRPDLAIKDGFVVIPSTNPVSQSAVISPISGTIEENFHVIDPVLTGLMLALFLRATQVYLKQQRKSTILKQPLFSLL
jgi:hypothetical protein